MSNIDKRALREAAEKHGDDDILALLDELEAAEKRIAELEAREVKLPERYEVDICPTPSPDGDWYSRDDVLAALVSAGVRYAEAAGKGE
ncbi:ead/Ea22-like family protein [Enterobacter hormaechei]|uniref:ead/Ea22-like family protein n=1 Tax=Enterobacter hormaechei TaxID=158836 RepID=UPI000BB68D88|nr:ead/Ea22-like family protein [Enterobacter hormaechei]MDF7701084.1 ead/Ea22-like family protein [Enterobacter hormaechei subsp. steigerwaltii]